MADNDDSIILIILPMHAGMFSAGLVLAIHTVLLPRWHHRQTLVAATVSAAAFGHNGVLSSEERRVGRHEPGLSVDGDGGSIAAGSESLMEKYKFREAIKTVIEEEHLPELQQFLENIGLGDRLEVSSYR